MKNALFTVMGAARILSRPSGLCPDRAIGTKDGKIAVWEMKNPLVLDTGG